MDSNGLIAEAITFLLKTLLVRTKPFLVLISQRQIDLVAIVHSLNNDAKGSDIFTKR